MLNARNVKHVTCGKSAGDLFDATHWSRLLTSVCTVIHQLRKATGFPCKEPEPPSVCSGTVAASLI